MTPNAEPHIETERRHRVLVARAAEHWACIPVDKVRWIGDRISVHPVPFDLPGLIGLARWAGEPLLVFSLESLMGWGAGAARDRMTLVVIEEARRHNPVRVFLAVDEVAEVVPVEPGSDRSEPMEIRLSGTPRTVQWFQNESVFEAGARSEAAEVPNRGPGE